MIRFGSRRIWRLTVVSGAVVLAVGSFGLAEAGSSPPGAGIRARSASCVGLTPAQEFKAARLVLVGVMLPGPSSQTGELLSPANVRVARFLKGNGPSTVHVQTAIQRSGSGYVENADGIDPRAGQRWKIYSESKRQPYATSVCGGSRRIAKRRHSPPERTFRKDGVRLRYPGAWHAYSYSDDYSSFSNTIAYLSNVRVHDPCVTHKTPKATTTRCGQPVNHLAPGAILVSWSANGFPGWSFAMAIGTPIRVDGRRAKLLRKKATCRIRAEEEIDVTVQRRPADNWYFVRACIRGPRTARFEGQFKRLLKAASLPR